MEKSPRLDVAAAQMSASKRKGTTVTRGGDQRAANVVLFGNVKKVLNANRARVLDMFRAMDKDGGGTIDLEEFAEGLQFLGINMKEYEVKNLFQVFDQDGDGEVSYPELQEVLRMTAEEVGQLTPRGYTQKSAKQLREDAIRRRKARGFKIAQWQHEQAAKRIHKKKMEDKMAKKKKAAEDLAVQTARLERAKTSASQVAAERVKAAQRVRERNRKLKQQEDEAYFKEKIAASEKAARFKQSALTGRQKAKRRVNKAKEKEWVKEWEKEEKTQKDEQMKAKQMEERRVLKAERDEKFREMQMQTKMRLLRAEVIDEELEKLEEKISVDRLRMYQRTRLANELVGASAGGPSVTKLWTNPKKMNLAGLAKTGRVQRKTGPSISSDALDKATDELNLREKHARAVATTANARGNKGQANKSGVGKGATVQGLDRKKKGGFKRGKAHGASFNVRDMSQEELRAFKQKHQQQESPKGTYETNLQGPNYAPTSNIHAQAGSSIVGAKDPSRSLSQPSLSKKGYAHSKINRPNRLAGTKGGQSSGKKKSHYKAPKRIPLKPMDEYVEQVRVEPKGKRWNEYICAVGGEGTKEYQRRRMVCMHNGCSKPPVHGFNMCVIHGGKKVIEQGRSTQTYTPSLHHKLRQPSPSKPLPKRHWEGTMQLQQVVKPRVEPQAEEMIGQSMSQMSNASMDELLESRGTAAPVTRGQVKIKTKVLSQQQTLSARKQMAQMQMLQQQQDLQQYEQAGSSSSYLHGNAPRVLQSAESAKAWGDWTGAH